MNKHIVNSLKNYEFTYDKNNGYGFINGYEVNVFDNAMSVGPLFLFSAMIIPRFFRAVFHGVPAGSTCRTETGNRTGKTPRGCDAHADVVSPALPRHEYRTAGFRFPDRVALQNRSGSENHPEG